MYTISRDYRNEIVIEKSRFICSLKKVASEAEAQDFIKAIKKEFWDATHNCSAYIVDDLAQRSSDDGEPSGTAGRPMLDVLKGSGITNILVTVTRYFGGTLLGTGGLVKAYGDSVKEVLALCETEEYIERSQFSFECDWGIYETIKRKIEVFHISDLTEEFATGVRLSGKIHASELDDMKEMIKNKITKKEIEICLQSMVKNLEI